MKKPPKTKNKTTRHFLFIFYYTTCIIVLSTNCLKVSAISVLMLMIQQAVSNPRSVIKTR